MVAPPSIAHLPIPERALQDFAQRWHVAELSLFGSVLREDFGVESDVDILVDFAPPDNYSLGVLLDMKSELEALLQRPVDLVVKSVVEQDENPYRRREILNSARIIYRAG